MGIRTPYSFSFFLSASTLFLLVGSVVIIFSPLMQVKQLKKRTG